MLRNDSLGNQSFLRKHHMHQFPKLLPFNISGGCFFLKDSGCFFLHKAFLGVYSQSPAIYAIFETTHFL